MAKEKTVIRIGGMHCTACAQTIERALKKEPGIIDAYVNFAAEKATVEYDSSKVSLERIADVIRETGYEPVGISKEGERTREVSLIISGMSCASCAATIEKALRKLDDRLHYGAYPQVQLLTISGRDESVHLLVTGEGGTAKVMEMEKNLAGLLKKIGDVIGKEPTMPVELLMKELTNAERELIRDELVRPLVEHLDYEIKIEENRVILDLKGKDFALVDLPDDPVLRTVVSYFLRDNPIVGVSAHSTARDVAAKLQATINLRKLKVVFSLPWSKVDKLPEHEGTRIIQQYHDGIKKLRERIGALDLGIKPDDIIIDLSDLSPEDAKRNLDGLFREEDNLVLSFWEALPLAEDALPSLEIGRGGRFTQGDVHKIPVSTPGLLVAYTGCRCFVTGWPDAVIGKRGVLSLAFWERFSIGDSFRFVNKLVDRLGETPDVAPQAIPLLLDILQELGLPGMPVVEVPSEDAVG